MFFHTFWRTPIQHAHLIQENVSDIGPHRDLLGGLRAGRELLPRKQALSQNRVAACTEPRRCFCACGVLKALAGDSGGAALHFFDMFPIDFILTKGRGGGGMKESCNTQ